ncbi:hypothetical protein [Marinomonas lutimaris]|uniref:hypothetical protein n=1 Tax=Marinomonas lutimaris TaxID=2846746 RepID=UPI001CA53F57|nr:hypothetical protein [Marinomonas lutimaris]
MPVISYGHTLHKLSVHATDPVDVAFPADTSYLEQYINMVVEDVIASPRSCKFRFVEPFELVPSRLLSLINKSETFEAISEDIVKKLHSEELEVQKIIKKLKNEVSKGVLIQVYFNHDGLNKYLIIKVDDNEFLDLTTLKLTDGLPSEKTRTQKTALITFDGNEISELLVSDSNSKISKFWCDRFLCAEPLVSSEINTFESYTSIDKVLNKVKKDSRYDYLLLKNGMINYYRNNDGFVFDDVVSMIKNHTVENKNILNKVENYDEIKSYKFGEIFPDIITEIESLPDIKGFDRAFDITKSAIKSRLSSTVVLDEFFDLNIKGDLKDLKGKIKAGIETDGRKFIKIYSELGYREFEKGE